MKNIKATVALLLAAVLLIPMSCMVFAYNNNFVDVEENSWYYDNVIWACEKGIFSGKTATTFAPNQAITRSEFVGVLAKFAAADLSGYTGNGGFYDVNSGAWYAPSVCWASQNGIVSGDGTGNFLPNKNINRQEMCAIFMKYLNYAGILPGIYNLEVNFSDSVYISAWAKSSVREMQMMGVVSGMEDGSFAPVSITTRAQASTMFRRLDTIIGDATGRNPKKVTLYNYGNMSSTPYDDLENTDILIYVQATVNSNSSVTLNDPYNVSRDMASMRRSHPNLKIQLLVVGNFADACVNNIKTQQLVDNLMVIMHDYDFDGVDIDWEFPTLPWHAKAHTRILKFLREAFDADTTKDYILSAAVPAGQWCFDITDLEESHVYLDYVNIMSYDMNADKTLTTHHTAPYPSSRNPYPYSSMEGTCELFINYRIPRSKIMGGVGYYPRIWYNVYSSGDGLGVPTSAGAGFGSNATGTMYFDEEAQAAYTYNPVIGTFASFDEERSVAAKCNIANDLCLGGLMIWSSNSACGLGLLANIRSALNIR